MTYEALHLQSKKDETVVEINVKCGEIIIFYHNFLFKAAKFPSDFVPVMGILSKSLSWGGVLEQKI